MKITLKIARKEDIPEIFLLNNSSYYRQSCAQLHKLVESNSLIIAVINDNIVGVCGYSVKDNGFLKLLWIHVDLAYRNEDIENELLRRVELGAIGEKLICIFITVNEEQLDVIDFYTRRGYVITQIMDRVDNPNRKRFSLSKFLRRRNA